MWIPLYLLLVGIFLLLMETGLLSNFISHCATLKESVNEKLLLKYPGVKALFYYFLSVPCFTQISPALGPAVLLNATTILQIFAQCNRYADAQEAASTLLTLSNQRNRNPEPHGFKV